MTLSALTIAGSDPGGGAGIQADLRVFHSLGLAGLSAITALTAQNSLGVKSVYRTPPDVLAAQLDAIFEDFAPAAVKIGMVGGAEQARVVASALRRYKPRHIVLDPVLATSGGFPLLDEDGISVLIHELLPLCDLVTPNLDEARLLTGLSGGDSLEEMKAFGWPLIALGAHSALIKGGHRAGDPADVLIDPGIGDVTDYEPIVFQRKRIETVHTHGTGCFLSAAIAGCLADGFHLHKAVERAGEMLQSALLTPVAIGHGPGYPNTFKGNANIGGSRLSGFAARLAGLYVITDTDLPPKRSHLEIAVAALGGGAKIIQLRDKSLRTPELIELARTLQKLAQAEKAIFIVNDRVDVAIASKAHGVHLGPDDMPPKIARRILQPFQLIGVSVGSVEEATAAAPYASYLAVGAIYGSVTKRDAGSPVGLPLIREIKAAVPGIPLVAIGGINETNICEVTQAGADSAAVISAVVSSPDMISATKRLVQLRDSAAKPA